MIMGQPPTPQQLPQQAPLYGQSAQTSPMVQALTQGPPPVQQQGSPYGLNNGLNIGMLAQILSQRQQQPPQASQFLQGGGASQYPSAVAQTGAGY